MTRALSVRILLVLAALSLAPLSFADDTAQTLPFSQDWSNTGLITTDDDWSGVPGVVGFRGDGLAGTSGATNPQTVVGESTVVDVNANLPNPNTFTTGGVAEFHITNPVVALQGSGTARAPYIQFHVNTTGWTNIHISYNLRDVDGSADNAIQPIALQFRVGSTGNFTNVPAGFVADATTGPNLATLVTPVSVTLPAVADNKPLVQIRVITTDAAGSDEWVGIDDISITGSGGSTAPSGIGTATPNSVAVGATSRLTVAVTPGSDPTSTGLMVAADLTPIGGSNNQQFFDDATHGDQNANDNIFTFDATVASGTTGGAKTLVATITDAEARSGAANISLTVLAPISPTGTGTANPSSVQPGDSTLLTVNVTPGANPPSTGITVVADLSTIGGSAAQMFAGSGNTFTFATNVSVSTTAGMKTLPVTITDAEMRTGSTSISITIEQPPPAIDHVVISQIYGGGGNSGATFQNDYVELFNPTSTSFDLAGWTLAYASAAGTSWSNNQPLGGTIAPGEYFLISLASGGAVGAALPTPNIVGEINMSATTGKIALVSNGIPLSGPCPIGDPDIVDFVGYGTTATCREGTVNAPAPSNTSAIFRRNGGFLDTNQNGTDFIAGTPNPRRTTPVQEIGPSVFSTEPFLNGTNAPRDASITINFTEPVDTTGAWYDITCASSGSHNDATIANFALAKSWVITPNTNFLAGEQCTVTVFRDFVHDVDLDDSAPNTDALPADYSFSFTIATGTAPPYAADVHLAMGNPSGAVEDVMTPNNYLMVKPEFALSYNRDRGTPNWVSWHLSDEWVGTLTRVDTFRADPAVPPDWYRVQATDFFTTGFDRGHMVPNADRDKETSIPINQATFLMTNMLPQAPDNNQGPWANLENFLRTLLPANEIYIVAGGAGTGGTGSNGGVTNTVANGHVTVPALTWKVALVLPKVDGNDVARVTAAARTIAVILPNTQGIRTSDPNDWMAYLTTVDAVESLTGYDFFANVEDAVENAIEAGINGANPPGVTNHSRSTDEDVATTITLEGANPTPANPLTFTIVGSPAHGMLSGSGNSRTYTPAPDFNGSDSFTFTASDGLHTSNVGTVTITVVPVNDPPTIAAIPDQTVFLGDTVTFTAVGSDIDSASLTYSLAGPFPATATISNAGVFSWTPTGADAGQSFTFDVVVSDGSASGSTSANVTVIDNAAPVITPLTLSLTQLWPANHKMVDITVSYTATDMGDPTPSCTLSVTSNEAVDGTGSGDTAPDWEIVDAHKVRLRAERSGSGNGRQYTITADCVDRFLNAAHQSAFVAVPLNQGK